MLFSQFSVLFAAIFTTISLLFPRQIMMLFSSDSETIIIKIAYLLSNNGILAAIIAGLTMSGILACTMSTADSQLLAASSSFSKNILQDFLLS